MKQRYYSKVDAWLFIALAARDLLIPEIREVKDSHDPITAPAMSLKRIKITTKGGSEALISPKNKEEFIASLLRINPNIKCSK